MMYLTSDTHFNHHNIIEYDQRPFKDVEEMNECLINNWNETVGETDIVYFLGDFGFGRPEEMKKIMQKLNGNICIVIGNHEVSMSKLTEIGFKAIANEITLNYKGIICVMSHEPIYAYKGEPGLLNFHGHTHSKDQFDKNLINVSCSAWDYKPIEINDLILKHKKQKKRG